MIHLEEWECSVRIIYDPVTHAILTRTVESSAGGSLRGSFELQKQAFLSVSRDDADLRWMPDGDRYVVRGPETAHIPPRDQHLLRTREMALRAAE